MSYTLAYKGAEIDDILGRAAPGGAIDTAIAAKQDVLTFDAVPTEGSTNPAESGGIYDAIQAGGETALAAFATDSVSGDIVSFPDGADGIPVKSFVGSIIPAQSGSGDPAPDNVRPISGWTGANITRAGVNVWNEQWESGGYSTTDGSKVSGTNIRCADYIPVIPESQYYCVMPSGTTMRRFYYDEGKNFVSTEAAQGSMSVTIPSGCHYMTWHMNNAYGTTYGNNISINYPSTDTAYHAYNGQTILLSFGQTVYAGTLTALGGGLWSVQPTHALTTINDVNWLYSQTLHFFYAEKSEMATGESVLCSAYNYVGAKTDAQMANADDYSIAIGPSSPYLKLKDTRYTTAAGLKADMGAETILYPLATLSAPITITGEDLQTLLGANTVWTDVGSVTGLTYRADTALYIQKLLNGGGTLQTLSMASPSPSLSLGRVGVLAEPEADAEPEEVTEEPEADTEEATEE